MYEDFIVKDRWSGAELHCMWKATMVAIATRHADAVDVRFDVSGRPVTVALPHPAWVEFHQRTGHVITDRLAIQIAGRFLKQALETGLDNGREIYVLSVDEVLAHLDAVMHEAGHTDNLPVVPSID
jgi:hypothetical protein